MGATGLTLRVMSVRPDPRTTAWLHQRIWSLVRDMVVSSNVGAPSQPILEHLRLVEADAAQQRWFNADSDRLSFAFQDFTGTRDRSTEAIAHWIELALAALWPEVRAAATEAGYRITSGEMDLNEVLDGAPQRRLFLAVRGHLFRVEGRKDDLDQLILFGDGDIVTGQELNVEERAAAQSILVSGRCACAMCDRLRTDPGFASRRSGAARAETPTDTLILPPLPDIWLLRMEHRTWEPNVLYAVLPPGSPAPSQEDTSARIMAAGMEIRDLGPSERDRGQRPVWEMQFWLGDRARLWWPGDEVHVWAERASGPDLLGLSGEELPPDLAQILQQGSWILGIHADNGAEPTVIVRRLLILLRAVCPEACAVVEKAAGRVLPDEWRRRVEARPDSDLPPFSECYALDLVMPTPGDSLASPLAEHIFDHVSLRGSDGVDARAWIHTAGLGRWGCPDLEILDLPIEHLARAVEVLHRTAAAIQRAPRLPDPLAPFAISAESGSDEVLWVPLELVESEVPPAIPGRDPADRPRLSGPTAMLVHPALHPSLFVRLSLGRISDGVSPEERLKRDMEARLLAADPPPPPPRPQAPTIPAARPYSPVPSYMPPPTPTWTTRSPAPLVAPRRETVALSSQGGQLTRTKVIRPGVAALLSILVPGFGQMMAGQVGKGLLILTTSFFTCGMLGVIPILAAVDAYLVAERIRKGEEVGKWRFF